MNYYNEIDPYAARWLQALIDKGAIAPGHVDTRSIEDVTPNDLSGYTQCHFFAGIGVWSYALRLADWPDDRRVWTGSCPCQPFSAAGKGGGIADERHLWPAWFHLIDLCRPAVIFGEQVASPAGLGWFDTVHADMERAGYAVGAADLCAAGVGAPHIRQRLYFVADSARDRRRDRRREERADNRRIGARDQTQGLPTGLESGGSVRELADHSEQGREPWRRLGESGIAGESPRLEFGRLRNAGDDRLGNNNNEGLSQRFGNGRISRTPVAASTREAAVGPGHSLGFASRNQDTAWADADWIWCRDGKWRPTQPGLQPLAHGIANRVGRLRAYGNAIVAPLAQAFIESYLETT